MTAQNSKPPAESSHVDRASVAKHLTGASVKWVGTIGGILTGAGLAGFGPALATIGIGAVCVIAALTIWGVSRT
jgi:hypothetical protein